MLAVDRKSPNGRKSLCKRCDSERSLARYRKLHPVEVRRCTECDAELDGRKRAVCGPTCRERRFKRLRPEAYAKREAAKVERRREARRRAREAV